MVFNIIQSTTKHCRVCGTSLWLSGAWSFDPICDDCRCIEDERRQPSRKSKKK